VLDTKQADSHVPVMPKLGPHSRPDKLQVIDGRRAEAKLMKRVREELVAHCGGAPSSTQQILINRAAALSLRLHLMDREAAASGGLSEKNGREYLCWNNALVRLLRSLGLDSAASRQDPFETLADIHERYGQPRRQRHE
jgi:hypothetical protein